MIKKYWCSTCRQLKRRYEVKRKDDGRCYWYECKWCHKPVETTNEALEKILSRGKNK